MIVETAIALVLIFGTLVLYHELGHFAGCVRTGGVPFVPLDEARHAVEGIVALARSVQTGAPVSV